MRPTSDWRVSVSFHAQAWRLAYIDVGSHTWELSNENPIMPKMLSLHDPRFHDRRVG